jgi:hypothetical protein
VISFGENVLVSGKAGTLTASVVEALAVPPAPVQAMV